MNATYLKKEISKYFKTLAAYGRTTSKFVQPEKVVYEKEKKFLKYLDLNDLYCMFCNQYLVVIQIDYKIQRPVWGCLACRFTKGLQKIKWLGHCADCGDPIDLPEEQLADQKKYLDRDNIGTVCDKCIGNGNILNEEDLKRVHLKKPVN